MRGRIGVVLLITVAVFLVAPMNAHKSFAEDLDIKQLDEEARRLKKSGNYADAIIFSKRSVALSEQIYGPEHRATATRLSRLAILLKSLGRFVEAEPLYKRALKIAEKEYGSEHRVTSRYLSNLGVLYKSTGRLEEAEPLYRRALSIAEISLGREHPDTSVRLNNLAILLRELGRYDEAEKLFIRALKITEKAYGEDHPDVGIRLNNLGVLLKVMGRDQEAERVYIRALRITENALGPNHPDVGLRLQNLAGLYNAQGKLEDSVRLYLRALNIATKSLGPDHPAVALRLNNLGYSYLDLGEFEKAEQQFKTALEIREKAFRNTHPHVRNSLETLVALYQKQNRPEDEAKIRARLAKMPEPGTRHVPLYFVTNRNNSNDTSFGSKLSDKISFGRIVMQVPGEQVRNRATRLADSLGQLEKAKTGDLTKAKALKIVRVRHLKSEKQLAASVRANQARAAIFKNQALVFVHGFNNDFDGAMKRATQLSFDLQFDGTLVPFTWPSQGDVTAYLSDRDMASQSIDPLVAFLDQLRDTMPELKIHLLAHSLGNRVLLRALCKIARRKDGAAHNFGHIISAHADVSYEDFEQLAACFKNRVDGITLYINENDTALAARCAIVASYKCRAGNYARGYKSADVIDTTQMGKGFFRSLTEGLDHDVFVRNPLLFSDIARLILTGQQPVDKRTQEFRPKKGPKGYTYWAYDPLFDPAAQPLDLSRN